MRLVIIGAGGHGQLICETAKLTREYRDSEIVLLDDRFSKVGSAVPKYGTVKYQLSGACESFIAYIDEKTEFYPAFGTNELRLNWELKILKAGGKLATIIHPKSYVAPSAMVQSGSVILANAIVNAGTAIGRACIVNVGAIVEHGCILSDGCHIDSGAVVMAENLLPSFTKVESGEVVPVHKWWK